MHVSLTGPDYISKKSDKIKELIKRKTTRPTIWHLHLANTCYTMHFIGLHFQPIISFLHGAGHVTFVIHYTIVSNIIVLSSRWHSIVYRLAYFVLYVTICYT